MPAFMENSAVPFVSVCFYCPIAENNTVKNA